VDEETWLRKAEAPIAVDVIRPQINGKNEFRERMSLLILNESSLIVPMNGGSSYELGRHDMDSQNPGFSPTIDLIRSATTCGGAFTSI